MASARPTMSGLCRASLFSVSWIFCGILLTAEAQTTSPAPIPCASRSNSSCAECLQNVSCLWCAPSSRCIDYPVGSIVPPRSVCPLNDARWGVCWVNFQILIITLSVLAGVLLISIIVCLLCCCKCERIGSKREDDKVERQSKIRKARQKERRTEMHLRHDEIRQKYGLSKNNPYARMDDP